MLPSSTLNFDLRIILWTDLYLSFLELRPTKDRKTCSKCSGSSFESGRKLRNETIISVDGAALMDQRGYGEALCVDTFNVQM